MQALNTDDNGKVRYIPTSELLKDDKFFSSSSTHNKDIIPESEVNKDNLPKLLQKIIPFYKNLDFQKNPALSRYFTVSTLNKTLNLIRSNHVECRSIVKELYSDKDFVTSLNEFFSSLMNPEDFQTILADIEISNRSKNQEDTSMINTNEFFMEKKELRKEINKIPEEVVRYHIDNINKKSENVNQMVMEEEMVKTGNVIRNSDDLNLSVEISHTDPNEHDYRYDYEDNEEDNYVEEDEKIRVKDKVIQNIETEVKEAESKERNFNVIKKHNIILKKIEEVKKSNLTFEQYLESTGGYITNDLYEPIDDLAIVNKKELEMGLRQYEVSRDIIPQNDFKGYVMLDMKDNKYLVYVPEIWLEYRQANPSAKGLKRYFNIVDKDDVLYRATISGKKASDIKELNEILNSDDISMYLLKNVAKLTNSIEANGLENVVLTKETATVILSNKKAFESNNRRLSNIPHFNHLSDLLKRAKAIPTCIPKKFNMSLIESSNHNTRLMESEDYDIFTNYKINTDTKLIVNLSDNQILEGLDLKPSGEKVNTEQIISSFPTVNAMYYNEGLIKEIERQSNILGKVGFFEDIKEFCRNNVGGTYSPVTCIYRFHTVLLEHYAALNCNVNIVEREVDLDTIYTNEKYKFATDALDRRMVEERKDSIYYLSHNSEILKDFVEYFFVGTVDLFTENMDLIDTASKVYNVNDKIISLISINGNSKGFPNLKLKRKDTAPFELLMAVDNLSNGLDSTACFSWLKTKKDIQKISSTPRNFTPQFANQTVQLQAINILEKNLQRSWDVTGNMLNFSVLSQDFNELVRSIVNLNVGQYVIYNFCDNVYVAQRLESGKVVYVSLDIIKSESHISPWHYQLMYYINKYVNLIDDGSPIDNYLKQCYIALAASKVIYTDGEYNYISDYPLLPSGSVLTSAANNYSTSIFLYLFKQSALKPFDEDGNLTKEFHDIATQCRIRFSEDYLKVDDFTNFKKNDRVNDWFLFQRMDMLGYDCVKYEDLYIPILAYERWMKSIVFDKSHEKKDPIDDIMRIKTVSLLGHGYKDNDVVVYYLEREILKIKNTLKDSFKNESFKNRVTNNITKLYDSITDEIAQDERILKLMNSVYTLLVPGSMDMIKLINDKFNYIFKHEDVLEEKMFYGTKFLYSPNSRRISEYLRSIYGDNLLVQFNVDEFVQAKRFKESNYVNIIRRRNDIYPQFTNLEVYVNSKDVIFRFMRDFDNFEFDSTEMFIQRNALIKHLVLIHRIYMKLAQMTGDNSVEHKDLYKHFDQFPIIHENDRNFKCRLDYDYYKNYPIISKDNINVVRESEKSFYKSDYDKFKISCCNYIKWLRLRVEVGDYIRGMKVTVAEFVAFCLTYLRNMDGKLLINEFSPKNVTSFPAREGTIVIVPTVNNMMSFKTTTLLRDLISNITLEKCVMNTDAILNYVSDYLGEEVENNSLLQPSRGYSAFKGSAVIKHISKDHPNKVINKLLQSPFMAERFLAHYFITYDRVVDEEYRYNFRNQELKGLYIFGNNIFDSDEAQSYPVFSLSTVKPKDKDNTVKSIITRIRVNTLMKDVAKYKKGRREIFNINTLNRYIRDYGSETVRDATNIYGLDLQNMVKFIDKDALDKDIDRNLNMNADLKLESFISKYKLNLVKLSRIDWDKHIKDTTLEDYISSENFKREYRDISFSQEYLKRRYNLFRRLNKEKEAKSIALTAKAADELFENIFNKPKTSNNRLKVRFDKAKLKNLKKDLYKTSKYEGDQVIYNKIVRAIARNVVPVEYLKEKLPKITNTFYSKSLIPKKRNKREEHGLLIGKEILDSFYTEAVVYRMSAKDREGLSNEYSEYGFKDRISINDYLKKVQSLPEVFANEKGSLVYNINVENVDDKGIREYLYSYGTGLRNLFKSSLIKDIDTYKRMLHSDKLTYYFGYSKVVNLKSKNLLQYKDKILASHAVTGSYITDKNSIKSDLSVDYKDNVSLKLIFFKSKGINSKYDLTLTVYSDFSVVKIRDKMVVLILEKPVDLLEKYMNIKDKLIIENEGSLFVHYNVSIINVGDFERTENFLFISNKEIHISDYKRKINSDKPIYNISLDHKGSIGINGLDDCLTNKTIRSLLGIYDYWDAPIINMYNAKTI